ncbi:DUF6168 family protein [Flavobacterium sp. SM15]|uniref:DUF6168 family protein n=1 Tax=Flavobacterium sp. SM15 TaxID=2908005 RepID=UPI001EDB1436|nr:DUF6168 family protein [Flavobacterium sp. SM15]MCG2610340.1 DUF6168 family protein [Flavobacterium sp. SM15]
MQRKKYALLLKVVFIALPLAFLNFLILEYLLPKEVFQAFHYSIFELYLFFISTSVLVLGILIKMKDKHRDQLGYVFLLVSSIKLALCYLVLLPVLEKDGAGADWEKINFFMIFVLFLAIEVVFTSKLLNDTKQSE